MPAPPFLLRQEREGESHESPLLSHLGLQKGAEKASACIFLRGFSAHAFVTGKSRVEPLRQGRKTVEQYIAV